MHVMWERGHKHLAPSNQSKIPPRHISHPVFTIFAQYYDRAGNWIGGSLFHAPRQSGPLNLRKRKNENKTVVNWGGKGRRTSLPSFFLFPAPPTFRVPFSFASSPVSESLEQAR